MNRIIEVNEHGDLTLPHDVLGDSKPHTQYQVEVSGSTLVLRPLENAEQLWSRTSPEDRAQAFMAWIDESKPSAPALSEEAVNRESFYD